MAWGKICFSPDSSALFMWFLCGQNLHQSYLHFQISRRNANKISSVNLLLVLIKRNKKKQLLSLPLLGLPRPLLQVLKRKGAEKTSDLSFAVGTVRSHTHSCYLPLAALPPSTEPAMRSFQGGAGKAQLPAPGKTSLNV